MPTILKYPGAKARLAPWITSFFPEHDSYLEPFCGSAAVLLAKKPCRQETINDIDGEVVNLFNVLRDQRKAEKLADMIDLTPYAEDGRYLIDEDFDDVERARRYIARTNMSISGGQKYSSGFKHSVKVNGPRCPDIWSRMPEQIRNVSLRMKDVYVRNRDALTLIHRYDFGGSLIYVDPPYPLQCRKRGLYSHEMNDDQHTQLVEILRDIRQAMVIVSGYDCEPYITGLSGWHKETISARAESAAQRTEILWMNFEPERRLDT